MFSISIMHSHAKKSASESRIFAGNCHFLMHESRVCNEFRRKQSTALGFGVLYYRTNVKNWIRAPISRILRHSLTSQFAGCRWSRSLQLVATSVAPARPAKKRAQPAKTSAGPAPISPPFDGLEGRGVILWTISNKLGCKPTDAYEIPV